MIRYKGEWQIEAEYCGLCNGVGEELLRGRWSTCPNCKGLGIIVFDNEGHPVEVDDA
jgi:DnaJ-class molecular chaperone